MSATIQNKQRVPSQMPLMTDDGKSIIPKSMSKCPSCQKRGNLKIYKSVATLNSQTRCRFCENCGHTFETVMTLPDHCPSCGGFDTFYAKKTEHISGCIYRKYRCDLCGHIEKATESIVPTEEVRKARTGALSDFN